MLERKFINSRYSGVKIDYDEFKAIWIELNNHLCPIRNRYLLGSSASKKKPERTTNVVDAAAIIAVDNFAKGMLTGAMDPSSKWFKVFVNNKGSELNYYDDNEVVEFCQSVTGLFADIFASSNFYRIMLSMLKDFGRFGLGLMYIEQDFENVALFKHIPLGTFKIGKNHKGELDTVFREYSDTVKNIVDKFGLENCSTKVKTDFQLQDGKGLDKPISVMHAVFPNPNYKKNSPFSNHKKYISVYYEITDNSKDNKYLSERGLDYMPYALLEDECIGEDTYPSDFCGIRAFPEVKELYEQKNRRSSAVDKLVRGGIFQGPADLIKTIQKTNDKGQVFISNGANSSGKVESVFGVNPAILELRQDMSEQREYISSLFYNDVFAMILQTAQRQRTATEIDELKSEKLTLVGPLMVKVNPFLKSVISILFQICLDVRIIYNIPESISGESLDIEFVSIFAMAAKASEVLSLERFILFISNLAQLYPIVLKKFDPLKGVDAYAEVINLAVDNLVSTEDVEKAEAAEQEVLMQQAQSQQMMNSIQQGSEVVKNLQGSQTTSGQLSEMLG